MGMIKGQKEYEKFKRGEFLTRKQAMLAQCYECNGFEDSNEDCQGKSCPMYQYQPYKGVKKGKQARNEKMDTQASIGA